MTREERFFFSTRHWTLDCGDRPVTKRTHPYVIRHLFLLFTHSPHASDVLTKFTLLHSLTLSDCSNLTFLHSQRLSNIVATLQNLTLDLFCKITDTEITTLNHLTQLRALTLWGLSLTLQGVAQLKNLPLQSLTLNCFGHYQDVGALKVFSTLQNLTLWECTIENPEEVRHLRSLKNLRFERCQGIFNGLDRLRELPLLPFDRIQCNDVITNLEHDIRL